MSSFSLIWPIITLLQHYYHELLSFFPKYCAKKKGPTYWKKVKLILYINLNKMFKIGVWKYTYKIFNWIKYSFNTLLFYSIPKKSLYFTYFIKYTKNNFPYYQ
jgi:hypothetical protein